MDILVIIVALLMFLALLVGVVSLLALLIMAISKKSVKKVGIVTGSAFGVAILAFVTIAIIAIVEPVETTTAEKNLPDSSADANNVTTAQPKTSASAGNEADDDEETEYDKNLKEIQEEREKEEAREDEDLSTEEVEPETEVTDESDEPEEELKGQNLEDYRTDVVIRDVERNPEQYEGELIKFEGKIVQVQEDDVFSAYRIAVNDDYEQIVYLETLNASLDSRLLENDYVTIYGTFDGLMTYTTVLGAEQTIPAFFAHGPRVVLNEY